MALIVTVHLSPGGTLDPSLIRHQGTAVIHNVGGTETKGTYRVRLSRKGDANPRVPRAWREGTVFDFPRKRLGAWDLVFRALHETVGVRNLDYRPLAPDPVTDALTVMHTFMQLIADHKLVIASPEHETEVVGLVALSVDRMQRLADLLDDHSSTDDVSEVDVAIT